MNRLSISAATGSAVKFAKEAYPGNKLKDIRLEEADRSNSSDWLITLSWLMPKGQDNILDALGSLVNKRVYKVFVVDIEKGGVKAMKIREVGE